VVAVTQLDANTFEWELDAAASSTDLDPGFMVYGVVNSWQGPDSYGSIIGNKIVIEVAGAEPVATDWQVFESAGEIRSGGQIVADAAGLVV
jgi:hypothetical protein